MLTYIIRVTRNSYQGQAVELKESNGEGCDVIQSGLFFYVLGGGGEEGSCFQ